MSLVVALEQQMKAKLFRSRGDTGWCLMPTRPIGLWWSIRKFNSFEAARLFLMNRSKIGGE